MKKSLAASILPRIFPPPVMRRLAPEQPNLARESDPGDLSVDNQHPQLLRQWHIWIYLVETFREVRFKKK